MKSFKLKIPNKKGKRKKHAKLCLFGEQRKLKTTFIHILIVL